MYEVAILRIATPIANRTNLNDAAERLGFAPDAEWRCTNLVDPASSHMLVSKIKPCMSQYKLLYGETANGSLKQLSFIWWSFITWITMVILELIHAS